MNQVNIISVDPGVKTMGELNMTEIKIGDISRRFSHSRNSRPAYKKVLNFILGINSKVNDAFSCKMMLVRLLAGCLFIAFSIMPDITGSIDLSSFGPVSVLSLALGITVILGILVRATCASGMLIFGYLFYNSYMAGVADYHMLLLCCISTIIMILGPGRYCIDQFIRRGVSKLSSAARKRTRRKTEMDMAVSYKAYGSVDRRVS